MSHCKILIPTTFPRYHPHNDGCHILHFHRFCGFYFKVLNFHNHDHHTSSLSLCVLTPPNQRNTHNPFRFNFIFTFNLCNNAHTLMEKDVFPSPSRLIWFYSSSTATIVNVISFPKYEILKESAMLREDVEDINEEIVKRDFNALFCEKKNNDI